jgi:hypothetical protein
MKKVLLFSICATLTLIIKAQHNYDDQSVIYSAEGKVGVGTNSPDSKLDVEVPYGPNQDEEIRMGFYPSGDANRYYGLGLNFKVDDGGNPSKHIVDYVNGTKYYSMTFKGGDIGINRINPVTKLDVEVPYGPNQDEEIRMGFYPSGDANRYYGLGFNFKVDDGGNPSKHIVNYDNGIKYYSMTFKGENVGIGTDLSSNPNNYKLAVNGTIGAKEIKVEVNTWSDFVFHDKYYLKTLQEVEDYININNHLPDIPAAKEVEENGVNVAEMDAKLLQKIEELTLYMIEMNKRVNTLESENSMLKEEIKEFKYKE